MAEEDEVQTVLTNQTPADQEVPREAVLQEPAPGEFDFNEFFNLDKSVPGLASVSFLGFKTGYINEKHFYFSCILWKLKILALWKFLYEGCEFKMIL